MITHVAIIYGGKLYSLPNPNRHHHVIWLIARETGESNIDGRQGFLADNKAAFLSRHQALAHALKCGQITSGGPAASFGLFSEDVW
jgi:hypothetical protein